MPTLTTETANSPAFTQNATAALATTSGQLPSGAPANSAPRATIVLAATTRVSESAREPGYQRRGGNGRQEEAVDHPEQHRERARAAAG